MQTVRSSVPLLGLLLLATLSLCSAASIGFREERLPGGDVLPGGPGRVCVQDDKGNLVCGKVVGPGSPAPPRLPPMDFLLPPIPPAFHQIRDHDHSDESKVLLPLDLFSLPSFLGDFSDESASFPLDDVIREMGKAHSCAPGSGQVMSDGKLIMDCIMAGDDLPGPVSMHVTYDLSDLPDDFSIRDLVSRRGMDMLLPPPLWQMMADLMPMGQLPALPPPALPLVPPPTKMAPPTTPTPAPTQQPEKAADKERPRPKLDPFHEQMNEIRSSFDAVLRDAMENPTFTSGPVSGSGPSGPAMHVSIDGDVSVLGAPSLNSKQPK